MTRRRWDSLYIARPAPDFTGADVIVSKTKLQQIDRRWRDLVFQSLFTRVLFSIGLFAFCVGMVAPEPFSTLLMKHVFPIWFGCSLLAAMSSYSLTLVLSLLRRDFFAVAGLATILFGFAWLVRSVLVSRLG